MNKALIILTIALASTSANLNAQSEGITNTSSSKYAKMSATDLGTVQWNNGFWGERFKVCQDTMILSMWNTLSNPDISHAYRNIEIAAGDKQGAHWGPPFHDGDFYKWLESVAAVYTVRTICEAQNYAYSISPEGIWCHLYGGSTLSTKLQGIGKVTLSQSSNYPWSGAVRNRQWKQNDVVELNLDMPVRLLESTPLVEETRN